MSNKTSPSTAPGKATPRVPANLAEIYRTVSALTDECCRQHLSEEYRDLCREMIAALSRKRPSPLLSGNSASWACGVVYALGRVNFLFDRSQKISMKAEDLCRHFGVSANTGASKARTIEKALKIGVMDPLWTLPGSMDDNPMAWMIQVNGIVVDARRLPRELQEKAFRLGLIPYISARKEED